VSRDFLRQKAQGHTECRVDFVNYPSPADKTKKLHVEFGFVQIKYYSGTKINLNLFVTKAADNIMFKFAANHQSTQTTSSTAALVQYAVGTYTAFVRPLRPCPIVTRRFACFVPDKNVTAKLDVLMPQSLLLNVDTKFKLTIPSGKHPMTLYLAIKEKVMNEYDVNIRPFRVRLRRERRCTLSRINRPVPPVFDCFRLISRAVGSADKT